MTSARSGSRVHIRRTYAGWVGTDVVLICLFAFLGHLSHYGTPSATGIAVTALPFLAAYFAVTAILRPWRRPAALLRTAVPLWVGTAAGGLALRVVFGESAALSFQIVALCVLGVFIVLPRSVATLLSRSRRSHPSAPTSPVRT